jgi:hypothetical protein
MQRGPRRLACHQNCVLVREDCVKDVLLENTKVIVLIKSVLKGAMAFIRVSFGSPKISDGTVACTLLRGSEP